MARPIPMESPPVLPFLNRSKSSSVGIVGLSPVLMMTSPSLVRFTRIRPFLSAAAGASNVEQWAVNKAVHYNEWANFGKKDFQPVVAAFKALLACFRCDGCESWMHITPRAMPESLRCGCNAINFNLKPKPK